MLTEDDKLWLKEQLQKIETTFFAEFHKCGSPLELRQSSRTAALRALDAEMEFLSDWLKKLDEP